MGKSEGPRDEIQCMRSIDGERWASEALPTDEKLTFFIILGPIDLAAGKAPIENVERCGASSRAGTSRGPSLFPTGFAEARDY